ncbi:YfjI family protein [Cupriavidus taiwanensis]|uniref:YfjI family protein n=1 Tax=Cupriavidus taiwanensis TaxID=164546 RepID=UPI00319DAAD9
MGCLIELDTATDDEQEAFIAMAAATDGNLSGDEWPEPQALIAKIEPEPYPLEALPPMIGAAVEEVQAFIQAPVPLVASCALSALSLAIQPHVDVQRAEKLHGPCALFLLSIADSGERKSTCDRYFMQPIRDYERAQEESSKPAINAYKADHAAWEAKRDGIQSRIKDAIKKSRPTADFEDELRDLELNEPAPPKVPRLLYENITPEKLAFELGTAWPSGGIVSAEAGVVFGGHAMSADSVMRNLAQLNLLWDGAPLRVDRRTSESFSVRSARLTVALQIQEATLRSFIDRVGALARGTGFLARFLVAWPQSTQGTRMFRDAPASWPHLEEFNRRITELLEQPAPIEADGTLVPAMLMTTPEAKVAWTTFHNEVEIALASGGDLYDVRDVASKAAENAARLAGLFHKFAGTDGAIDADAIERACAIAYWHLSESRRFLGELALPQELADACRLDDWLLAYCRREHTHMVGKNHVRKHGPGPLRNRDKLNAAITELANLDRLRVQKDGKRITIQINPALLGE